MGVPHPFLLVPLSGKMTYIALVAFALCYTTRSIPNFREVYNYIRSRLDDDAQQNSPELPLETKSE